MNNFPSAMRQASSDGVQEPPKDDGPPFKKVESKRRPILSTGSSIGTQGDPTHSRSGVRSRAHDHPGWRERAQELHVEMGELHKGMASVEHQIKQVHESLAQRTEPLERLETDNLTLKQIVRLQADRIKQHDDKIEGLTEGIRELGAQVDGVEADLSQHMKELRELVKDKADCESLNDLSDHTKKILETMMKRIKSMRIELDRV